MEKINKEFLVFNHGETVSSIIRVSPENFEIVKKALAPTGITFRSPDR